MMIYGEQGWRPFTFDPPSDASAGSNARRLTRERDAALAAWRDDHNKVAESARKQGRPMPYSLL